MGNQKGFAELSGFKLDAKLIQLLPLAYCHVNRVVVLEYQEGADCHYRVGMVDTTNSRLVEALGFLLKAPVRPVQLSLFEIHQALKSGYGAELPADRASGHVIDLQYYDDHPAMADSSAPDLVDLMLIDAIVNKASDIHLENYLADTDLRYRLDGILQQFFTHITLDNMPEVVNRLKVLSELDIAEKRRPQDGRFRCTFVDDDLRSVVDFRLNILPGPCGEDAVIRVLDASAIELALEKLGLTEDAYQQLNSLIQNPEGLILVTGPTGSGKTTTLYSALNLLKNSGKKIITAEDPIEYYVDKINQKQVSGVLDMAALSRSFLRHDPDVMLIGEIRDEETAETAAKAALTGHLVLSTLHTPDAIGAVQRLRGLGMQPDEIANALLGVVAQRLVRRICPHCSVEQTPSEEQRRIMGALLDGRRFRIGSGCDECNHTGYRGRTGIYELLLVDESIQRLIFAGASTIDIRRAAQRNGFTLMLEDGLDKVDQGITSLDEILRVIPYRQMLSSVASVSYTADTDGQQSG